MTHAPRLLSLALRIGPWIDVKNEARVHLWYAARFGTAIPPDGSDRAAIDTFPTTATALGLRPAGQGAEVHAPFGLADLFDGVVRPNKRQITRPIYQAKVDRWARLWPGLRIVGWDAAPPVVTPPAG